MDIRPNGHSTERTLDRKPIVDVFMQIMKVREGAKLFCTAMAALFRAQKIETRRKGVAYEVDGFLYSKDKEHNQVTYLKCRRYKEIKCSARATFMDVNRVSVIGSHDHERPNLIPLVVKNEFRSDSANPQLNHLSVGQLYKRKTREAVAGLPVPAKMEMMASLPTKQSVERTMRRVREEHYPSAVANSADLVLDDTQVKRSLLALEDGSSFLLADSGRENPNRFLIFGSEQSLQMLADGTEWYIDGTFLVVPLLFAQLVSIHSVVEGQHFPLVYVLMSSRTEDSYNQVFTSLLEEMGRRNLNPRHLTTFITDFEAGLLAALTVKFPVPVKRGCYFHYAQSIHRAVKRLGFAAAYNNEADFRAKVGCLIAMGLVPADYKVEYMRELARTFNNDVRFQEILQRYFIGSWMRNQSRPYELWDWYMVENRTNNAVESWNNTLRLEMARPHLSFWKFVEILKAESVTVDAKVLGRLVGVALPKRNKSDEEKKARMTQLQAEFPTKTPIRYLMSLAYRVPLPNA